MDEMRCWICGVEPVKVDVTALREPQSRWLYGRWPDGDHKHAARPPSPDELVAEGFKAVETIRRALAGS